ncbi:hypothetical protein N3Z17_03025 [Candidatus Bandiella numerosa]|uniref:hypothetical protein n=1 Tax=Candidatus Bandiella numerosa TaxID=2570586 RepID=UPI00249DAE6D|nr:hypothetical protein [Candidatus Bandiella numerosa]WHA05496.1 hypothetical protein N3Z17_03025 [Candidatus Bandiella numerosa]
MARILFALICVCLIGCNTNVTKNEKFDTNSSNPLKNKITYTLVCTKIPNAPDELLIEFYKYAYNLDKYKNNSSISDQVREDNKLKGVEVTLKILSENKQEIKIDKIQAIEDLKLIFNGTDSNNIYQDKMIHKILNLPIHRAANVIRLLLKTGCELYK